MLACIRRTLERRDGIPHAERPFTAQELVPEDALTAGSIRTGVRSARNTAFADHRLGIGATAPAGASRHATFAARCAARQRLLLQRAGHDLE